jgi:hypothetical protein
MFHAKDRLNLINIPLNHHEDKMETSLKNNNHVYLQDSIIWHPNPNTIYHIKDSTSDLGESTVRFSGKPALKYIYFDLASGMTKYKEKHNGYYKVKTTQQTFGTIFFISKESLPPSHRNKSLPSIYLIDEKNYPNQIIQVSSLNLNMTATINLSGWSLYREAKICNEEIQSRYKKLIPNIPITVGKYPIFIDNDRPNAHYIEKLYQNYLDYNKKSGLINQYLNTKLNCHIRAHFIGTLLYKHGIQTVKVYKIWPDENDWVSFPKHPKWKFHCASMIIDADNHAWVWDPWIYFNKKLSLQQKRKQWSKPKLLTLNEWANNKKQPIPKKLSIANYAVITDYENGLVNDGTNFMKLSDAEDINLFQALASDLPNPPEYPLSTHIYSLFKSLKIRADKLIEIKSQNTPLIYKHATNVNEYNGSKKKRSKL